MFRSEYCYGAHTQVGFVVAVPKSYKSPELARWKYKVKINVEETSFEAQKRGFFCRPLEGQPKNKKGQNGWGEHYPLGQYEITGGNLPSHSKIQISPKTTQIFFFGPELPKPSTFSLETFESFLEGMESLIRNLEKAESLMNELSSFLPDEKERFGKATRTQTKVPAMYRLKITSEEAFQELLDDIMNKFYSELDNITRDMFQNRTPFTATLANQRLNTLIKELVFFQREIIKSAKERKDPNAQKWEDNLNNSLMFPFGSGSLYKKNC
jgi:hypothetical protein